MKYLWNDIDELKKYLERHSILLIFLDFDGTLSPIQKHPDKAKLSARTKNLLMRLSDKKNLSLIIVSGRQLDDLKKRIGISNLIYSGNHGLESEINSKRGTHPLIIKLNTKLNEVKERLLQLSLLYPGSFIEDKNISFSFHYRGIDRCNFNLIKSDFSGIIKTYRKSHSLKIIAGKKVFDVIPDFDWSKGHFAQQIVNLFSKTTKENIATIFIGDDSTDESAFLILKKGINIRVGRKKKTLANHYLKNSSDVYKFLCWIEEHHSLRQIN